MTVISTSIKVQFFDFYDTAEFIPFIDLSLFVSIEKGFFIRSKDTNQGSCPFCVEISFFQIRQRNFDRITSNIILT